MAVYLKRAYSGQPAASAVELYECPANRQAKISAMTATNDTTTSPTFKAYIVPAGESVGDQYMLIDDQTLGSKESYLCPEMVGQNLEAGDKVYVHPSAANQVTIGLSIVEITL